MNQATAFNSNELAEKERRARELMDREGIDVLVLASTANFAWFTCGGSNYVGITTETGSAAVVLTRRGKYVVCDNIEAPRIDREEIGGQGFELVTYPWHQGARDEIVSKLAGGGRVGSDVPIPGARNVSSEVDRLRWSLTEQEVARYRSLGRDAAGCLAETCREIDPGMTEHQIAGLLNGKLFARGIVPGVTLVAADERIDVFRHPLPSHKRVENRVMLVTGARRHGLIVSCTRIVSFGEPSAEILRRHAAVTRIDAGLIARTVPGANVGEVFRRAVEDYCAEGFPEEWKLHHQGGPTGYKGREYRATSASGFAVMENQAFAWNPSITGTKSEDTMIATSEGPVIVSEMDGWPLIEAEADGFVVKRPDILVR